MDIVSTVAATLQLIGTTTAAVRYLDDVKGSVEDRQTLAREVSTLQSLLTDLDLRINPNLSPTILSKPELKGSLDQVRVSLQELTLLLDLPRSSSSSRSGIRNLTWRIWWPTKKKSATELLQRIMRANICIGLVLQLDIW